MYHPNGIRDAQGRGYLGSLAGWSNGEGQFGCRRRATEGLVAVGHLEEAVIYPIQRVLHSGIGREQHG